jgi:PAS domain S-box-containing protein
MPSVDGRSVAAAADSAAASAVGGDGLFRAAFESAAIGMALVAGDGRCLRVNPALCDLLGKTPDALRSHPYGEMVHPDDRDNDAELRQELVAGVRSCYRVEQRFRLSSGQVMWLSLNVALQRDPAGRPALFVIQFQDVTGQKRAEHKSERLGRIVKMMSEGNQALVQATDEQQLFQAMCEVVVEAGGYRMAWMGVADNDEPKTVRPVAWAGHEDGYLSVARISWADNEFGAGPSGKSVRTGLPQINDDFSANPVMSPWRAPALARGYRSSISLPLKERNRVFGVLTLYAGEPYGFSPEEVRLLVELAEDVSYGIAALRTRRDHDELERTLFQAQKMESLGQLTGGIAHDFNNLLQVVLSNLDLALGRLADSPVAALLQSAVAGAEQGAKLTGQLLAFARRQPLRPLPLRVDRLVGDMTHLLRRTLGETIAVELSVDVGLGTALVDGNQLQNALLNLALNARDAMPEGGTLGIRLTNADMPEIEAAVVQELKPGRYVMVAVTDTGLGMTPEVRDKAFEPFFTTKPEGVGTGLGLSMVYGFIRQSGGHVAIDSALGRGTTVTLFLPRTEAEASAYAEAPVPVSRGGGEVILVAEDDDGVRATVVAQLSELGYSVLAAANGEAALALLVDAERVDLLFTDIVMPGACNGRVLAEQAQQLRPGLPVVFTSGYTEDALIHDGRLDEGVTLLCKPYRLTDLARVIQGSLSSAAAPAAKPAQPHVLLVDDEELVREVLCEGLGLAGYRVSVAEKPSEALRLLAAEPGITVVVTDFGLPEMNGVALSREILVRRPELPIILATGYPINPADLPSPDMRVLLKPFFPSALRREIEALLGKG